MYIYASDNGDLRLLDHTGSGGISIGRLEIFLSAVNDWGTVCLNNFDVYEADIACKQLGYLYASRVGTEGALG